jgi:hypothetical protein
MVQALTPREVKIRVRDGIEIGAAIYAPEGTGRFIQSELANWGRIVKEIGVQPE